MKLTLKTSREVIAILMTSVLLISIFSCNKNKPDELIPEKVSLVSPNGFVLSENVEELITLLNLSPESKITNIYFLESGNSSVAFVTYNNASGRIESVALARGNINYDANEVSVQPGLKSTEKIKVSCSGCENCRVMGTISPDGTIKISCESSCCTMTIEAPNIEN